MDMKSREMLEGEHPSHRLFICTDLDRTLLPNGEQPESPGARSIFARLVSRPEVSLAYVSGRHLALVKQSIHDYGIPEPDWIVGDVGSSIYQRTSHGWSLLPSWSQDIAQDWHGLTASDLVPLFSDFSLLSLQPEDRQNIHKLSYFIPLDADVQTLIGSMQRVLEARRVAASLIYSVDEQASIGLLDVLPQRATKLHAVEFLIQEQRLAENQTVFAGDSGNDLPVLTSSVPSILVANAHPDVIQKATAEAIRKGTTESLYLARGGFMGMNGNYSAGILEGVIHFHADLKSVLV
jgi:sucrose-6F-phosphate phosphohydrolase